MAAILAFRSSRRLAISLSFSSLLILAILGVAAAAAGVAVGAGSSSGISSHPEAAGAAGADGLEGGLGEVTGVGLAELVTGLETLGFPLGCAGGAAGLT